MAFVAASSYIYEVDFGVSSQAYSLFFAFYAVGVVLGPPCYLVLSRRVERTTIMTACFVVCAVSGLLVLLVGARGPWFFILALFPTPLASSCLRPPATYLLLGQHEGDAGSVSSLVIAFLHGDGESWHHHRVCGTLEQDPVDRHAYARPSGGRSAPMAQSGAGAVRARTATGCGRRGPERPAAMIAAEAGGRITRDGRVSAQERGEENRGSQMASQRHLLRVMQAVRALRSLVRQGPDRRSMHIPRHLPDRRGADRPRADGRTGHHQLR